MSLCCPIKVEAKHTQSGLDQIVVWTGPGIVVKTCPEANKLTLMAFISFSVLTKIILKCSTCLILPSELR